MVLHSVFTKIPTYLMLGLSCGIIGALFVRALDKTEQLFTASKLPMIVRPMIGALLLGILGYGVYMISGFWQSSSFLR